MKRLIYTLSLLAVIASLTSCDNFDLLLSEKKLNKKIQKSWKIVLSGPSDAAAYEAWTFKDGAVALHIKKANLDTTYNGTYSVDARFSKAYVSLDKFIFTSETPFSHKSSDDLNRRWTIAELDGGVLYLSSTSTSGTIQSLEFVEQ